MLIVFEGIDGCGKTTVLGQLCTHLINQGIDVITTSEFANAFPWCVPLRRELMASSNDPVAQYHCVLKARDQHVTDVLKPAEKAGKVVLMDRYLMSTLAYQGQNPETPVRRIMEDHELFQFPVADLTILLTCYTSTASKRQQAAGKKRDAFDLKEREFFSRAHEIFLSCAHAVQRHRPGKVVIIDTEKPFEDVMLEVIAAVSELVGAEAA
jgi:dTMP kinase